MNYIVTKTGLSIEEMVADVIKKGGHINKYYLEERNRNKHTIVYLKGWFGGKNVREALTKALA